MNPDDFNKSLEEGILTFSEGKIIPNETIEQPSLFGDDILPEILYDPFIALNDTLRHRIIDSQKDLNKELLKYLKEKYREDTCFFIPNNVPSLKNSYVIGNTYTRNSACCNVGFIRNGDARICPKCGQLCQIKTYPSLKEGKICKAYKRETIDSWIKIVDKFKKMISNKPLPIRVAMYFIRDSRRIFDYINAAQIIQDILADGITVGDKRSKVMGSVFHDDNMIYFKPVILGYHLDPKASGILITEYDKTIHKLMEPK